MPGIGRSTVAILGPEEVLPWGTGVLVGPRHVLTCAHVVGDALGDRNAIGKNEEKPEGALRVRFTVAERPTIIGAKVAEWSRYFERAELATDETADRFLTRDLALLQLDADPPRDAKPVRFWHPADPVRCGWLYALYQPPIDPSTGKTLDATKPAGQWNEIRLLISPTKCEHVINGVKYFEYVLGSDDFLQRVAKSKFSRMPLFAKPSTGYIALQGDHGQVSFRNIKIRPIQAEK